MARSSGFTASGQQVESFVHASFMASGFAYSVTRNASGLRLAFSDSNHSISAEKPLRYFIGSGTIARSYLMADDHYLFEAPIAFYTQGSQWALAPRFDSYSYPFLTRAAMPGCINCHASFPSVVEHTQNRYRDPPFAEAGIACERCHGPGADHAARKGPIVNPGKLDPERRDSVCSQCHLSGDVRVHSAGRTWKEYRPGDKLSDSIRVFVRAGARAPMTVTGHVEQFELSACKQASVDRMWCGSCHNVHAKPTTFRARCLACHLTSDCHEQTRTRTARGDDCVSCHMPKSPVRDAQHMVFTDHSIPRRPRTATAPSSDTRRDLVAFRNYASSPRDLALACAIAGDTERAFPLLRQAAAEFPNDTEVLIYLAEAYRNSGDSDLAVPLYRRAMELDPDQVTASVGLGAILMERRQFSDAIPMWEDALAKNAGLVLVRTNLAQAYLRTGHRQAAERQLLRVLELSPAFAPAAKLLTSLRQR
jgi:hypothetical protein